MFKRILVLLLFLAGPLVAQENITTMTGARLAISGDSTVTVNFDFKRGGEFARVGGYFELYAHVDSLSSDFDSGGTSDVEFKERIVVSLPDSTARTFYTITNDSTAAATNVTFTLGMNKIANLTPAECDGIQLEFNFDGGDTLSFIPILKLSEN